MHQKSLKRVNFEIRHFLGYQFFLFLYLGGVFLLLLTEMVHLTNCIFGVGYETVPAQSMLKQKLSFNVDDKKY